MRADLASQPGPRHSQGSAGLELNAASSPQAPPLLFVSWAPSTPTGSHLRGSRVHRFLQQKSDLPTALGTVPSAHPSSAPFTIFFFFFSNELFQKLKNLAALVRTHGGRGGWQEGRRQPVGRR